MMFPQNLFNILRFTEFTMKVRHSCDQIGTFPHNCFSHNDVPVSRFMYSISRYTYLAEIVLLLRRKLSSVVAR